MIFSNTLLTLLAFALVLGPLVALHEWGHYIVARLCGVKVLTYSIGFGPKIASWTSKKTGINYRISALPLGGYVKMLDSRETAVSDDEKHLDFNSQHPLKKIAIVVAGPLMNFFIAIALFWLLFVTPSEQLNTRIGSVVQNSSAEVAQLHAGDMITAINNTPVQSWETINLQLADMMGETGTVKLTVKPYDGETPQVTSKDYAVQIKEFMQGEDKGKDPLSALGVLPWQPTIEPIIGEVIEGGAASRQGMQAGDKVIKIDDSPVKEWSDAVQFIHDNPETLLTFTVLRDGKSVELKIMPQGQDDGHGNSVGKIGVQVAYDGTQIPASYKTTIVYDPMTAVGKAVDKTYDMSVMTLKGMGKMLTGMIGLENLSGPITIAKVAKQTMDISWQAMVSFAGVLSVSLAVLNLLPIPVLDGGHMLYYIIELIRGKPLSERTQLVGLNIGMLLMMALMLLAVGLDISRLF